MKIVSFRNSGDEGVVNQLENTEFTEYFDEGLSLEDVRKFKSFKTLMILQQPFPLASKIEIVESDLKKSI